MGERVKVAIKINDTNTNIVGHELWLQLQIMSIMQFLLIVV